MKKVRQAPLDPDAVRALGEFCLREGIDPAAARAAVRVLQAGAPHLTPRLGDLPARLGM